MPATTYPAWSTPTDNVYSATTEDQQETEDAIHSLFASHRHLALNYLHPGPQLNHDSQRLVNPWLQSLPTETTPSSTSTSTAYSLNSTKPSASAPASPQPVPPLNRQAHLNFLIKQIEPLPAPFVSFDTNRAWLLYWILHSYDLLSATLDPSGRARAIATLLSFQNRTTGGFGGGPDQLAHLMSTFAAVLALATIGGPGPCPSAQDVRDGKSIEIGNGGWDDIDRTKMYDWMLSLKQPDGSFLVHENGEVDVRASYCVVSVSMLLGICTPQLVRGLGEFIASCQTYEGGLAAGSQPQYSCHPMAMCGAGSDGTTMTMGQLPFLADPNAYRPQLGEAHGGYAYCALATHLALSRLPYCGDRPILTSFSVSTTAAAAAAAATTTTPARTSSAGKLDVPRLLRWATSLQGVPVEGGGFRGRTNKLVDGCYGWFCGGGLFSVLTPIVDEYERQQQGAPGKASMESLNGLSSLPALPPPTLSLGQRQQQEKPSRRSSDSEDSWKTDPPSPPLTFVEMDQDGTTLYDRIALQEYILIAAQAPKGGLRDKPGKRPDAYHTNYNLAGMSLSQHRILPSEETRKSLQGIWKGEEEEESWRKDCYLSALAWTLDAKACTVVGRDDEEKRNNTLQPTHPVFTITFPKTKGIMDWAYCQL